MVGNEELLMTSLVLILATFQQKWCLRNWPVGATASVRRFWLRIFFFWTFSLLQVSMLVERCMFCTLAPRNIQGPGRGHWRNSPSQRNYKSKEMGRIVAILDHFKDLLHKLNHEASVWQIIFPDYLACICHYPHCDWLRHLSGQVIPSRKVV